ncbi:MAG: hypothetical protein CMJ78_23370 [Planctomycetaceae bacterium]|nr:hypothetical protein [Planctomycetaceae bacterium]
MSPSRCDNSKRRRRGLTLVELVVVLAILAVLAGVAVRSLQPIADQARYQASQKTLTAIEDAFLAGNKTGDGLTYSGFIADIGRLPKAIGATRETQAIELWNNSGIQPFGITAFDDPNTSEDESARTEQQLLVAAGWRGPYLTLAPGSNAIRDGYGRPMFYFNPNNVPAVDGSEIAGVVSGGSNGAIDEPTLNIAYTRDLSLPNGLFEPNRYQGALPVRVTMADGSTPPSLNSGESVVVRVYGPEDGVPVVIRGVDVSAGGTPGFGGVISSLVCGTRAVRALKVTGTSPNETIVAESLVRQVAIQPGMNSEVVLRLPN